MNAERTPTTSKLISPLASSWVERTENEQEPRMTLKELFPRRTIVKIENFEAIKGPHGHVSLSPKGERIDVVVDITSTRLQNRTQKIVGDEYMLTNDGEYLFRLNLSDKYRAMQLIGFNPDRRG